MYAQITRAKIEALRNYCAENKIGCQVITEKDLFNEDCSYQENFKEYKSFLLKCRESNSRDTTSEL